ncbi:MAG: VanZ family protein [Flaviramulus sp.]|nr:VanZ family protein [Flaviramulus sp.]NNC48925.1 VanZ family protein [Flaviramulus sp.]
MLKKVTLAVTILYSIALATVSLIRLNNLPDIGISFGDKIFHFLAYTLLTYLWFRTFAYYFQFKKKSAIINAALLSIIFGTVIEVLQDTLTVSRALDVYDVVANALGAILVSIVLWFNNFLHVKNS